MVTVSSKIKTEETIHIDWDYSMSNDVNKSGTLTGNATVDILQRKVTLKKELIHLRKLKVNEERQSQLETQIEEFDNLLKSHRLKK